MERGSRRRHHKNRRASVAHSPTSPSGSRTRHDKDDQCASLSTEPGSNDEDEDQEVIVVDIPREDTTAVTPDYPNSVTADCLHSRSCQSDGRRSPSLQFVSGLSALFKRIRCRVTRRKHPPPPPDRLPDPVNNGIKGIMKSTTTTPRRKKKKRVRFEAPIRKKKSRVENLPYHFAGWQACSREVVSIVEFDQWDPAKCMTKPEDVSGRAPPYFWQRAETPRCLEIYLQAMRHNDSMLAI